MDKDKPFLGVVAVRAVVALLIAAWLCWQIGAAALAALAERTANPALLAITSAQAHPQAGSRWAEALLATGKPADAAETAEAVIRVDPTNDRALRVLGLSLQAIGAESRGAAIMRRAAALGWRDTPTQLWALRDAVLRDDYVTVIERTDALARRNRSGELTRGILLAAITEPHLRAELIKSLSKQPMWRGAFFADVHQRLPATSADAMEMLFKEMSAKGLTIGPVEWLSYIDRLCDLGQFQRARAIWAQTFGIPRSSLSAMPFDNTFALVAKRAPDAPVSRFEWTINPDLIGAVTFGSDAGGTALRIPSQVAGGTVIISQTMVLSSGSYQISARVQGNAATAAAGWSVTCLPSKQELPRRLASGADDELSTVSFDVPTDGCIAQRLALIARDVPDAQPVAIEQVKLR